MEKRRESYILWFLRVHSIQSNSMADNRNYNVNTMDDMNKVTEADTRKRFTKMIEKYHSKKK